MMKVSVSKWGNSNAIRLPKTITDSLNISSKDSLNIEIKNDTIILSKLKEELTIEELFKEYNGGSFKTNLQEFEPTGNEKW